MQRRKALKEQPSGRKKRNKKKRSLAQTSKKDMTGKQKKRLSALEELMAEEPEVVVQQGVEEQSAEVVDGTAEEKTEDETKQAEKKDEGVFGAITGFYKKADSMAASQALLLNKELEDRGLIEKITDETGLKVVGKDAAVSKQEQQQKEEK